MSAVLEAPVQAPDQAALLASVDDVLRNMPVGQLLGQAEWLRNNGQLPAIIPLYRRWIGVNTTPERQVAFFNLGVELSNAGDRAASEQAYRQALAINPDLIEALVNLGNALEGQGRVEEALDCWRQANERLRGRPEKDRPADLVTTVLNQLGRVLEMQKQFESAEEYLRLSLVVRPEQPDVIQHWIHLRQKQCKWPAEKPSGKLSAEALRNAISPLAILAAVDDPAEHHRVANTFVARKFLSLPQGNLAAERRARLKAHGLLPESGRRPGRLRVGYLSGDLCTHAVGLLMPDFLECHDRSQVELFAYCYSPEDGSMVRQRLISAFDHFTRVAGVDDSAVAAKIAEDDLDVLFDMHALSAGVRPGVLALRPAPVQVTWLGYIGPSAMPWIDYVFADSVAFPPELEPFYHEKVLRVGGCFLPGDRKRSVGPTPTRAELGLPEDAFVFATFNNSYKLNPAMWATWMRILKRVPNSVLWGVDDNPWATPNLKAAVKAAGVSPKRLILSSRSSHAHFLGRMPLADLFLDNHPYNAGSTANDAVWMGLPMLTLAGKSFVSRMGTSLLTTCGVTELIAHSAAEYEDKAVALAQSPERLAELRTRLQRARSETDVFNMDRLARDVQDHLFAITGVPIPQPGEFSSERTVATAAGDGQAFKPLSPELRQKNREILGIRPEEFVFINLTVRMGQPEFETVLLNFAARRKYQPNLKLILQSGGPISELVARYPELLGPSILAGMMDVPFELTPDKRCAMYAVADLYLAAGSEESDPFADEARLCELLVGAVPPRPPGMRSL
jgi:predicted O-linked N-acetylglucosamine transferase (SPINDLY family)